MSINKLNVTKCANINQQISTNLMSWTLGLREVYPLLIKYKTQSELTYSSSAIKLTKLSTNLSFLGQMTLPIKKHNHNIIPTKKHCQRCKHICSKPWNSKNMAQFATRNANHRALKQCHVLHFPDQWAQAPSGVSTCHSNASISIASQSATNQVPQINYEISD